LLWLVFQYALSCSSQSISPQEIASSYSLTSSTIPPFPTSTQSSSSSQSFITSNWGLSKGRIQSEPQDLSFISDPFPTTSPADAAASRPVLQVDYPQGSFSHGTGGTQLYSLFNGSNPFQSMLLSYEVAFDANFNWVKGGKLPGIRGGPDPNGCSGGSKPNGTDCFSLRLMWRPQGVGEVYAYIPTPNNICNSANFICNPDFGISIHRGAFVLQSGTWNNITLLALLNDPPNVANGFIQLTFNGAPVITQGNLQLRASNLINAGGLYLSTFFGGDDSSWATPTDQHSYFRNFQLWAGDQPSNKSGPAASAGVRSCQILMHGALFSWISFYVVLDWLYIL